MPFTQLMICLLKRTNDIRKLDLLESKLKGHEQGDGGEGLKGDRMA